MAVQSIAFLFIVSLMIIVSKGNVKAEQIDIYTTNVTLEWETFSIRPCVNPETLYVALFKCNLSIGYLEVLDKSCLNKKILDFDNATCPSTITHPSVSTSSIFECENKTVIGLYCNVTIDPCTTIQPCKNNGTCHANNTLEYGFHCQCQSGYSGDYCENEDGVCKTNTCWHDGKCAEMHKIVSLVNQTTFDCNCTDGYDGIHCELLEDMCVNITCENGGLCFSAYLTWSCECLDFSLYYGKYCEHKSASLLVRQILSKSFASIAITAIITVFLFVIIMDILKFGFNIDPVDRERRLMKLNYEKKRMNNERNKRKKQTKIALRLFYVA